MSRGHCRGGFLGPGRLSLPTSQVAYQARAYPGFCSMQRL